MPKHLSKFVNRPAIQALSIPSLTLAVAVQVCHKHVCTKKKFYPNFNHNYHVFVSLPCSQSKPFPDLIGFHSQQWLGDLHTFVGGFPFTFHPPHCPMTHNESLVDFFDFPALMLNDTPAVLFIPMMLAMSSATQYELMACPHCWKIGTARTK